MEVGDPLGAGVLGAGSTSQDPRGHEPGVPRGTVQDPSEGTTVAGPTRQMKTKAIFKKGKELPHVKKADCGFSAVA